MHDTVQPAEPAGGLRYRGADLFLVGDIRWHATDGVGLRTGRNEFVRGSRQLVLVAPKQRHPPAGFNNGLADAGADAAAAAGHQDDAILQWCEHCLHLPFIALEQSSVHRRHSSSGYALGQMVTLCLALTTWPLSAPVGRCRPLWPNQFHVRQPKPWRFTYTL